MKEVRRIESVQELRQVSSTPRLMRSKQQRQTKQRMLALRTKEVFLTDTQTDQTKSSNQAKTLETERLEYTIKKLQKQNFQLKETILKLKASQFYGINEQKVKSLIKENQMLKLQAKTMRKEIEKILVEKDFFQRNNRALKEKYEEIARENNKPLVIQSRMKTELAQINDYQLLDDISQFLKENRQTQKKKRSTSNDKSKMFKKKGSSISKPQEKSNPESKKIKEGNSQHHKFNEDYYLSKQVRNNKKSISIHQMI